MKSTRKNTENVAVSPFSSPTTVLCFVGFMDLFGVSLIMPVIQIRAVQLGSSATMAGMLGSMYGFLQLFSSPIMGSWSDMIGHRLSLTLCLVLTSCGYCGLGLAPSLVFMFLARFPLGLFKHSQMISKAFLADILPPNLRSGSFGTFNAASSIGFIVGPTIGGHLLESRGGFPLVGITAAAIFAINAVIVWWCVPTSQHSAEILNKPQHTENLSRSMKFSFADIVSSFRAVNWAFLWDLYLINFMLGLGSILYRSQFGLMLTQSFQTSAKTNGYLISYTGLISTLFGFATGQITDVYKDDAKLFLHCALIQLCGYIAMVFVPNLFLFILIQIPHNLSSTVMRVVALSLTVKHGNEHETGSLMGLNQSTMAIARTISPFLAGVALDVSLSGPSVLCSLFAGVAIAVMMLKENWKLDYQKLKQH